MIYVYWRLRGRVWAFEVFLLIFNSTLLSWLNFFSIRILKERVIIITSQRGEKMMKSFGAIYPSTVTHFCPLPSTVIHFREVPLKTVLFEKKSQIYHSWVKAIQILQLTWKCGLGWKLIWSEKKGKQKTLYVEDKIGIHWPWNQPTNTMLMTCECNGWKEVSKISFWTSFWFSPMQNWYCAVRHLFLNCTNKFPKWKCH